MVRVEPDWMKQPEVKAVTSFELPATELLVFPNSIPLTLIHDRKKDAFRLDIVMACGQVDQSKLLQANTTCRMLREGTLHYSSQELAEKLDFYGAWLETATYFLYTRITLYSLTRYADTTIPLMAELIRNATMPEQEFEVVNNSNKAYSQVVAAKTNVKAQRALLKALFGNCHICGRFAETDDYDKLEVRDLRRFYHTYYNSSACGLFFSGELTEHLQNLLEDSFGKESWGNASVVNERKAQEKHTSEEKRVEIVCPASCQSSVRLGCFLMARSHPDFLFASFFNTLLGGFFGSRLMMELRERKGLTYGIGSTVSMYPYDTLLLISSETSEEHVDELIKGIYQEISRLQNDLVSQEELSLVKNYYVSDLCRTYEEPFSIADYCINMKYFGLPYDSQEKAVQLAKDATPAAIREFACKWLSPSAFRESVAGKFSLNNRTTE